MCVCVPVSVFVFLRSVCHTIYLRVCSAAWCAPEVGAALWWGAVGHVADILARPPLEADSPILFEDPKLKLLLNRMGCCGCCDAAHAP